MKFTFPVWILVIAAAALSGVVIAFIMNMSQGPKKQPGVTISSLALGKIIASREGGAPHFQEGYEFASGDQIALHVESQAATKQISLSVRLLDDLRRVIGLSPSTIQIASGSSNFCCWKISQPGNYLLQIFKPDGLITPVNITIQR